MSTAASVMRVQRLTPQAPFQHIAIVGAPHPGSV
jgi:hypothetical protein